MNLDQPQDDTIARGFKAYDVISEYEVEKAILKLNKDSSPGPDGLTSNLYKLYSDVFETLRTDLLNDIITLGVAPLSFH